ncbi:MAG: hypothetical protein ABIS36_09555 [Chryseolinea sp.]
MLTRTSFSKISLLFSILFITASCASNYPFQTSSVVPAAEGGVKVKRDKNSNYDVSMSTIRLAQPTRLSPSRQYYVAWMTTEGNGVKNIGQLKSSSSLFSKTLKSSLETVTSFKPTGFFITAEDNSSIQYPSEQIILRTK